MDTIGLAESLTNYDDVGKISLEDTGMIPFLLIRSAQFYDPIKFDPVVFNRHLTFMGIIQDNYNGPQGPADFVYVPMRLCKRTDFKRAEKFFDQMNK